MSSVENLMKIGGLFLTLFMIYLIIAGSIVLALRYRSGAGTKGGFWYTDRTKLKKYIFNKWVDWAGYPAKFSNLASTTALSAAVYSTLNVSSPAVCMLACDGANESGKTAKCVGFRYEKKATTNVCSLATTLDGFMASESSNTLYLIDGLDTGKQFIPYGSKVMLNPTYVVQTPYRATSEKQCASNCMSNVECNGFTWKMNTTAPTTNCALLTNSDSTNYIAGTTSDVTYDYTTHAETTPYTSKYW